MERITRIFLVCALVGVMLAGLVSHYDEQPQTVTVIGRVEVQPSGDDVVIDWDKIPKYHIYADPGFGEV